ncbi:signal transduction histidine kinase [Streptosporangium becharense]|uniref:histidine kinase n=1 Tax=Streptosporangium becharense TaxID=1816182 RepID=A0A7W9IDE1_9ACTN|nr:ATP-binding protein [Streptosporangium becharense]MBB2912080.1 signal transduction histidine kinase [Streptosporangium becharense]MBB5818627.1 signal transduction histidine kinase [Streptosporangium becharense]
MLRRLLGDWRPTWLDLLLALAVGVAGLVESFGRQEQIGHPVPMAAGAVAAAAAVLLRRRSPIAMLLTLIAVGLAVREAVGTGYYAAWHFYSTLILVHTVASTVELRSYRGGVGLGCVLTAYAYLQTLQTNDIAEVLISAVFMSVAYGSGILLRRQIDQTLRLAERTTRLEVEREERARRAVAEERARIARELHDVISHKVSVMTLHAGGVRMLLDDDRERKRERDMLLTAEQAGREAVGELQLMLGVLREAGDHVPETVRPGLSRLEGLVAHVREAGPDVRLRIIGEPRPLPPGLDLSAYRVIQEALTNVLKHAGAGRADVVVDYGPDELNVQVTDDGAGGGPAPGTAHDTGGHSTGGHSTGGHDTGGHGTGGHGLIGMRERTAMHGGDLSAGPLPGGGYRVAARFPLGTATETG